MARGQEHQIFVWGGDINLKFTKYIADLTGKENPRLCYLPTASGDDSDNQYPVLGKYLWSTGT